MLSTNTSEPDVKPNGSAGPDSSSIHHNSSLFASPGKLSPAQLKVVLALAEGKTVTVAARQAGIHRTTIHHWLRTQPEFVNAAHEAQDEYEFLLTDQLAELAALALSTLRALLEDPKTPPSVRLKAALAVLERPRAPERSWTLPTLVDTPDERQAAENLAMIEADHKARKMTAAVQPPSGKPVTGTPPRNAPCPCGSGLKYKRCCSGKDDAKSVADASPAGPGATSGKPTN